MAVYENLEKHLTKFENEEEQEVLRLMEGYGMSGDEDEDSEID